MINTVIIAGKLSQDPELQYTKKNTPYCALVVSTVESKKVANGYDEVDVEIGGLNVWGERAEKIAQDFREGDFVIIEGKASSFKTDNGRFYNSINVKTIRTIEDGDAIDYNVHDDNIPF